MAAGVSTIMLTGQRQSLDARAAAREIMVVMRAAREQAIRSRREARFVIDLDQRRFWREAAARAPAPGGAEIEAAGGDGPARDAAMHALPAALGVELFIAESEQMAGGGGVRFFPDGSSTGGYVRLESAARSYKISADWLTGTVRVESDVAPD